jgi:hypothetical protein
LWAILGSAVVVLAAALVKTNVVNPRRQRALEALRQQTQVVADAQNLRSIMVIQKSSGILLYSRFVSADLASDTTVLGGFLQAIMLFSAQLGQSKTPATDLAQVDRFAPARTAYETLEFAHANFHFLVVDGDLARVALVLNEKPSMQMVMMGTQFLQEFEGTFSVMLDSYGGDTEMFGSASDEIFERLFPVHLLADFKLEFSKGTTAATYTKTPAREHAMEVIENLLLDSPTVRVPAILRFLPRSELLEARALVLELVDQRVLVPVRHVAPISDENTKPADSLAAIPQPATQGRAPITAAPKGRPPIGKKPPASPQE